MPNEEPSPLERALGHDRVLAVLALAAMALLSWLYLIRMAASMNAAGADASLHAAMGMPEMNTWGAAAWVTLFLMWTVMMIAMMLPSAAPVILLVLGTYRRRGVRPHALTAAFAGGYLLVWTVFSALAAFAQLLLHRTAVLTPAMASASATIGGGILVVAGAYQWLPVKGACLTKCRSPLGFLAEQWREGPSGALVMGIRHGIFCVGCCWALMTLLFWAGVMNLLWVGAIAMLVLVEKLAPHGAHVGRFAGVILVFWGTWVITS